MVGHHLFFFFVKMKNRTTRPFVVICVVNLTRNYWFGNYKDHDLIVLEKGYCKSAVVYFEFVKEGSNVLNVGNKSVPHIGGIILEVHQ